MTGSYCNPVASENSSKNVAAIPPTFPSLTYCSGALPSQNATFNVPIWAMCRLSSSDNIKLP